MKLQYKLFLVLISFSLIPLWVVTTISLKATLRTGRVLATETRENLTGIITRELEESARNYGRLLSHQKMTLEFAVDSIARQAELALSDPDRRFFPVFYDSDFDRPENAPPDLKPNPRYRKRLADGQLTEAPVSFGHPVYYLAPGVDRVAANDDVRRLSGLQPLVIDNADFLTNMVYRLYISLASGVHMAYPGHGGYPKDYDPRQRVWYTDTPEDGSVGWMVPIKDASTNQMIFTAARRFFHPDGSTAGVVGIDVLVEDVMTIAGLNSQWSMQLHTLMVSIVDFPENNRTELIILAGNDQDRNIERPEYQILRVDNPEKYDQLIAGIKNGKSGNMKMSIEGQPYLWAYTPLGSDLGIVVMVPQSVVLEMPEQAGKKIIELTSHTRKIVGVTALIAFLGIVWVAYRGARNSTASMRKMVDAWQKLAQGDFSVRLTPQFNDERDESIRAFNEMTPKLKEHFRITKSLELAQEVQRNLLPRNSPEIPGLDIVGASIYCDETGGDYFDFFELNRQDGRRFAIMVGDVSGHGISSALLMATARALLRIRTSLPGKPEEIIGDVNRQLAKDTYYTGQFMTLFYSEFEPATRKIHWVRAGHDPAIVLDCKRNVFYELRGTGMALGIDEYYKYELFEHQMESEQIILIGTDGIWEMHDEAGRMFSKEALKEIIRAQAAESAEKIMDEIIEALNRFRGHCESQDDVTMVVIKVKS